MTALQKEEYRARKMGKIESKAVDTLISQARQGGATVPHSAELLENLMEYFGGTAGFSSMMLKNYFDAKPGSATRTKMLLDDLEGQIQQLVAGADVLMQGYA
jgi:hypothetical protein